MSAKPREDASDGLLFTMCNGIMKDCKCRAGEAQQAITRPWDVSVAGETAGPLKSQV